MAAATFWVDSDLQAAVAAEPIAAASVPAVALTASVATVSGSDSTVSAAPALAGAGARRYADPALVHPAEHESEPKAAMVALANTTRLPPKERIQVMPTTWMKLTKPSRTYSRCRAAAEGKLQQPRPK